jgi:hypothetical protein
MRVVRPALLAAFGCLLALPSLAFGETPTRSAAAFHDSVGVSTHVVYYSTAYGNWEALLTRLEELGVRHLRDGTYANPAPQWRKFNERYYESVEYAADRGFRFNFGLGNPGYEAGTLDQLIAVVGGRLRRAAEAVEGPNEFDHFVGGRRWPKRLAAYSRALYRKVKAHPSLSKLPVVGPSLVQAEGPRRVGDLSPWLDVGNIHPYAGGAAPRPSWVAADRERVAPLSGPKPVWATEAGFHNAVNARDGQPPVSERAGAIYTLRTVLEHFRAGINRTYLYEAVDFWPDPRRRNPNWNFGLLRNDMTPKPAFTALKNLLSLAGDEPRRGGPRPLRVGVRTGARDVRRLVLQKADGSHLVILWRLASVWDRDRRVPQGVRERPVAVSIPGQRRVARANPMVSAALRPVARRGGEVRLRLGAEPLVLHVRPRSR